ncbi:universal stress protein [Psychromonas sp. KJ10-2]|uniref:universal stress protein n=1 Tax=Psychromonas sp. KJ10-2 TaxID=3391822 RepID=UPI0039B3E67D
MGRLFFKEGTLLKATEVANQTLIKLIAEVLPDNQNVHRRVKVGVVYEKVLLTIKKLDVDLVIIGAHKPTVIDHLMGPNAARIVRVSPVSTMVVRLN